MSPNIANNMLALLGTAGTIHQSNVDAGWWTDLATGSSSLATRNRGEILMLIVSELAEAWEGINSEAMDDKLPHREMFDVELADTVIRLLDLIGAELSLHGDKPDVEFDIDITSLGVAHQLRDTDGSLMLAVHAVVAAMEHHRKGRIEPYRVQLIECIAHIVIIADLYASPLAEIIEEKRAFNKTRPDHQIENRVKDGGKAY